MHLGIFAAEGPNGSQLASDINEVYWGSAAFFVVLGLIIWKAGPAIVKGLNGRTERIQKEFDAANEARNAAERSLSASSADAPNIGVETARIKTEAAETATRLRVDTAARANAEAAAMKERATNDIQNQTRQAIADLREEISSLTRDSTEALVAEKLDAGSQSGLIDSYISSLESSNR